MYLNNKFNLICKIFALAPISLNLEAQRALTAYSWLTILGVIISTAFSFKFNIYGNGYIVSSFVISTVYLSVVLAHITTIIESLSKRDQQQAFFAKLHEIDDIFRIKLRHVIRIKRQQNKLIWKYSLVSFVVAFHFFFYTIGILCHSYFGFFWYGIVSVIVSRLRYIQATVYVELISFRFNSMILLLRQIANIKLHQKSRILDFKYDAIEISKRMRTLKLVYTKLYDVVSTLNEIFGWSILALIVHYSLDLTCNIYWIFLTMEGYLPNHMFYECCPTLIQIAVLIACYCHACQKCVTNNAITQQLLQKMIGSPLTEDERYLIQQFLLQVRDQPIVVHVKRFFHVDLRLLFSIAATIIGYLIILIQFLYTENEL